MGDVIQRSLLPEEFTISSLVKDDTQVFAGNSVDVIHKNCNLMYVSFIFT